MRFIGISIFILLSNFSISQTSWFKHLDGFSARQSFTIGDTIYTIGNKITNYKTFSTYNVIITKISIDSSFFHSRIITSEGIENDSLRGTLMRYMRGTTLHNNQFYLGLSLVGNRKRDRAYFTEYSTFKGISNVFDLTKDTLTTNIENIVFLNNQPVVIGFYFYYLSQLTTKFTTFISYYRNNKILWSKFYHDASTNQRYRITNTLKNENDKATFFFGLQDQTDFAGVPRVWYEYIIKMDTLGNELWRCQPNNRDSINTEGMQMVQKPNGNILVSWCDFWYRPYKNMISSQQPQGNDNCTVWFAEIDANGKVLWRKNIKWFLTQKIARNNYENLFHSKVIAVKDGLIWSGNYSYYYRHNYLLKTDFNGNPIWYREYELYKTNTAEQEFLPFDVTATSDGGYLLTGEFISQPGNIFKNGCQLATIIKVDSFGCLLPGCQKADSATTKVSLLQKSGFKIYPNPNSGNFTIEIENPAKDVSIEVLDMMGKHVANVERVEKVNNLDLDIADGMYWVRVKNGGAVYNQKVSVVK